jgi:hypothetical protein
VPSSLRERTGLIKSATPTVISMMGHSQRRLSAKRLGGTLTP